MKLYLYMLVFIFLISSLQARQHENIAVIGTCSDPDKYQSSWSGNLQGLSSSGDYSVQEVRHAYIYHCYSLKTYGMSPEQVDELLGVKWESIVNRLLSLDRTEEVIWKLWNKYKQKRYWDFGWKDECEQKLKIRLGQKAEQKRLQELKSIYSESIIPHSYVSSSHELTCINRCKALQKTHQNGFKQEVKTYAVDEMTSGMMLAHGIDRDRFVQRKGTSYQHCLYQEVIDTYKQVAKLMYGTGFASSVLLPYALGFSDMSCDAIEQEMLKAAVALNDLSAFLVQFSCGVCAGVLASLQDNYHMLTHPVQTTDQLKVLTNRLLDAIVDVIAMHDCNMCNLSSTFYSVAQRYVKISDMVSYGFKQFDSWWQDSSIEQKSKAVSRVVSDCILPQKLCALGAKFCGMVVSRAKSCRSMTGMSDIAQELGLLGDEVVAAELLVEAELEQPFLAREGLESRKPLHAYKVLPFEMVMQRVRELKGVIPFAEKELLQSLKHHLERALKQANKKVSKRVTQQYKKVIKEFQGQQVEILSNLDHIGNFEFFITEDMILQSYEVKIMGGHLSGSVKELERIGLAFIKEEKMLANGFKQFVYEDAVTGKLITKTEFPAKWDMKKIMDKTFEAYDNFIVDGVEREQRILRQGVTSEGIDLHLVLDPHFEREVAMQLGMPVSEAYGLSRKEILHFLSEYDQRMIKSMLSRYNGQVKLISSYSI